MNIDLDDQFLKKIFGLTDRIIPDGQEITLLMLKKQLDEIEETMISAKLSAQEAAAAASAKPSYSPSPHSASSSSFDSSSSFGEDKFNLPSKTILIIDDLGVITYQLGVMFKKMGFDVVDSREIYDAIEKFKKQTFDLVIMDLFIPTEREGFILLEELKKTAMNKQKPVKIGVMSASAKKEHKQLCKIKGAEFYVEKVDDWQKELLSIIGAVN